MSDKVTINIYRRTDIWESDVWRGDDNIGTCTGPTMAGVFDIAYNIIADTDPEWADFNANEDL
jgi:hypothetical protein